ncbi:MAG: AAA family ATPase [Lachnospiraceae bacterium]|nr:AAA family ATPase [Lachnospiraceae bacterium]
MELWLGVENFAKIQSAKVCINKYSVLVGLNNSGKTFLMQLIQGMSKNWESLFDDEVINIVESSQKSKSENTNECENLNERKEYLLDEQFIERLLASINRKLDEEKENLVKQIFGKEIPIGRLFIEATLEADCAYLIDALYKTEQINEITFSLPDINSTLTSSFGEHTDKRDILILSRYNTKSKTRTFSFAQRRFYLGPSDRREHLKTILTRIFQLDSLFLPASRTGLLMLYKDFFANKTDQSMDLQIVNGVLLKNERGGRDLTLPVYEFIRFLQTFSENENRAERFEDEILFFEQHVIEGNIKANQHGNFIYFPQDEKENIPLFLASSMINEVAPIELALTGHDSYERLIIDEIEASLHPEKQMELVRFLNRINNQGIKLILSTHSDTFVSKLNNLYILSANYPEHISSDILERSGLEEPDLIDVDNLYVYEFIKQPDGKSIVKQVKGDPKKGFVFDLFTEAAMKLFDEAMMIEGALNVGKDQNRKIRPE